MRTIVKGKNAEVPDRVRDYAERKLKRIERLLDDRTDATVELWSEQHRSAADTHFAEVTLVIDGHILRSRATGSSYQEALDDVVDKVERQAVDHKEKPRLRARPEEEKQILRRLADGSEGPPPRAPDRQGQALRDRADVRGGRRRARWRSSATSSSCSSAPRPSGSPSCTGATTATYGLIEPVVGGDYTKGRSHAPSAPERASSARR